MRRYLPFAIIAAVLVATVIATVVLSTRPAPTPPPLAADATNSAGAEPPHVRGPIKAPLILEEFGDFECMPCFVLWPALRNIEREYGERLQIIFRQRPLPQHERAREAARAAEAAGLQGRFWEMHDLLYLSRSHWLRASDVRVALSDLAAQLGLDVDRFSRDLDSEHVRQRIAADERRGASLGVDRTPVLFLNGRRLQLQADVEAVIRAELERELRQTGR